MALGPPPTAHLTDPKLRMAIDRLWNELSRQDQLLTTCEARLATVSAQVAEVDTLTQQIRQYRAELRRALAQLG